jgi:hypothetical protein
VSEFGKAEKRTASKTLFSLIFAVGPMSLKVKSAKVPIVEDQHCTAKINTVTEKLFILPASSFCAGGSDGSDACQVRKIIFRLLSMFLIISCFVSICLPLCSSRVNKKG